VRVWVDITDASHVVFFAPIVRRLEDAGHTVTLTARRFADADLVLRRYGLGGVLTTGHRGGSLGPRVVGLLNRTAQLLGSASSGRFDVAAGSHASDFALTAWTLGIPQITFLDDERLRRSNAVNVRLVDEVAVPEAIPMATLSALGAPPAKLFTYPGFKEEYYLYDASPDPEALARLGVDPRRVVGVVRPARPLRPARGSASGAARSPDELALAGLARELAGRRNVTLVLVARDQEQRQRYLSLEVPGLIAPDGPVDGVGLIAAADFVLGDGGVMTREAAALGTPAYTVSLRAPAAVDAALLTDGRLKRAVTPEDVLLKKKRTRSALTDARDPQLFVDRLLELARRRSRRARLGRLAQEAGDSHQPPLV
jgi:predicted glycosyltransferase